MSDTQTFLDQALAGLVLLTEIDTFVDRWHAGEGEGELHDFLGMAPDEYALWMRDPDMIGMICAARRWQRPLAEAVNDNYQQVRMAARSTDGDRLHNLHAWLRHQGMMD